MMEAVRILKAVGVKPRRTIRVALWGGEEQGLLGSRAYVREHFADVDTMALKPEHAKLAAYFNSDNGTGTRPRHLDAGQPGRPPDLRAVDRAAARSRRRRRSARARWRRPITCRSTTSGVPAFQFLVDRLEYNSRTHHSNMDTFDRVQRDDMVQQATVIAVFAYNAAMRDEKLPRKALPLPAPGATRP